MQDNAKKNQREIYAMNNKFTVEEIDLICIFESRSRTKVISDI